MCIHKLETIWALEWCSQELTLAMDPATAPLLTNSDQDRRVEEEQEPVSGVRAFGTESKKLWKLAGPAILTCIFQYSLGALTQTFAGLVGEIELAAVSVENSVIAGLAFGVMVSLPSVLFVFVL